MGEMQNCWNAGRRCSISLRGKLCIFLSLSFEKRGSGRTRGEGAFIVGKIEKGKYLIPFNFFNYILIKYIFNFIFE